VTTNWVLTCPGSCPQMCSRPQVPRRIRFQVPKEKPSHFVWCRNNNKFRSGNKIQSWRSLNLQSIMDSVSKYKLEIWASVSCIGRWGILQCLRLGHVVILVRAGKTNFKEIMVIVSRRFRRWDFILHILVERGQSVDCMGWVQVH
jgi:hypothetical protein